MYEKCLGCHEYKFNQEEDKGKKYLFCSYTCMILAGYASVRNDFVPKHTVKELSNSQKLQDKLLNNPPVRVRDKDKHL